MNALYSGCLTLVVGLAASLVASPAEARETTGAAALAPKSAATPRVAAARDGSKSKTSSLQSSKKRGAVAASSAPSPLRTLPPRSAPTLLGSVSPRDAAVASVVAPSEDEPSEDTATALAPTPQPAKLKSTGNKLLMFTDGLLEDMGDVPVLGAFILPVTEGVTVPTFEGLTSLTFAVKPTKITRGSGVVAIGTFD